MNQLIKHYNPNIRRDKHTEYVKRYGSVTT